jgi:chemotaxis protein CheD
MEAQATVGMAELKVAAAPDKLGVHGLGSCVVVALYDPQTKLGGLAHAMLPHGPTAEPAPGQEQRAKFCDWAVPALLEALLAAGANKATLYARLVGGATMFSFPAGRNPAQALGDRNLQAAREALELAGIPLKAEEAGGSQGRSLEMDSSDGSLMVWSSLQYVRWL